MNIHPTASVDPTAELASDVTIGPWAMVGPRVVLGTGCEVAAHAVIKQDTTLGAYNVVHSFASVGGDHQSLPSHRDESDNTQLIMGDYNTIHEYCTINRGNANDRGVTQVGDHNLFMAYTHVAHDCTIHNHTVCVNHATLGGHVTLRDHARVGAFCAVHQFCDIGEHAFLTKACLITKDVMPYVMVQNNPPEVVGLNKIGLQRRGHSAEGLKVLSEAYRVVFRRGLSAEEAVATLEQMASDHPGLLHPMVRSLRGSQRGIER